MADVKKVIKDLAKSYGDSNEDQGKLVNLMKGLAFSDEPEANKFMKALDKWTTEYVNKNVKEESVKIITIEEEIAIVQEDGTKVILEKGDRIKVLDKSFLKERMDIKKGDLVFLPDMGSRGLVGLVVEDLKFDSEYDEKFMKVYLRGYNGEIVSVYESDDWILIGPSNAGFIQDAIDNGDISAYASIAKKLGIRFDPEYYYDVIGEEY